MKGRGVEKGMRTYVGDRQVGKVCMVESCMGVGVGTSMRVRNMQMV